MKGSVCDHMCIHTTVLCLLLDGSFQLFVLSLIYLELLGNLALFLLSYLIQFLFILIPPPISLTFFSFYSYNDQIGSDEPFPGVKVHCLVPTVGNDQQSLGDLFAGIFGKGRGKVVPVEEADVYILVWNCIRVIVGCKNARSLRVENGKCTPRNEKKTFLHKLCQNCSDLVLRFLQLPTLVFLTSCCACAIKSFKDHIHLPRAAPIGRSTHAGPGQNPHFPQPQGEITRSIVAHS